MGDLERVGLANKGKLNIDEDDLNALLSGRRTDMLRLENLQSEGIHIPALDAKLSLRQNASGALELLVHPIYREVEVPDFLTEDEAEKLENGEVVNINKFIVDKDGQTKEVVIEFDEETNEFIITDSEQILAPEEVNGKALTPEQKARYKKGQEVGTVDGTTFQYAAKEKQGIRSDRLMMIASVLIDGGLTYVLFKGLNKLFNKPQKKEPGADYKKALRDLPKNEAKQFAKGHTAVEDKEQSQSVGR